ncbi:3'-5' exonuclease [Sphingomonas mucosissima]|uniref:3'-5' exonuclease n=1 Tax=Sphingomonas mucosissima TaxID=370959 RepID=UPI000B4A8E49
MTWGRYLVCLDIARPIVVVDFETTGLDHRRHQIIELAAIRLLPGQARGAYLHRLVRPARKLSARIVELTGITDRELASHGVDAPAALQALVDFIGNDPVVSYNAAFDMSFLHAASTAYSLSVAKRGGHSCALRLVRKVIPGLPSYRLAEVSRRLGLSLDNHHRAVGDALRAAQIYRICAHAYLSERAHYRPGIVGVSPAGGGL